MLPKKYCYKYPRPALTVDIILIKKKKDGLKVLLIKRRDEPFKGKWALPGGFMNIDETLEQAAVRELREETSISQVELKQFKTFSTPNRDPRFRTVSTVFWAAVSEKISGMANDDAEEILWVNTRKLPPLAFDHAEIIAEFLDFQNKKKQVGL